MCTCVASEGVSSHPFDRIIDDDESDTEDKIPDNDTFWVDKDVLLDTIAEEDVKAALKERYESVLGDL